jgi:hypothetical protein
LTIKRITDEMYCGKFITFQKIDYPEGSCGPQHVYFWEVFNTKDGARLGYIEWFKKWKKFSFFNYSDHCVFEEICLGDIAQFLVDRTTEKKELDKASNV